MVFLNFMRYKFVNLLLKNQVLFFFDYGSLMASCFLKEIVDMELPMTCSNTLSIKLLKIQNSGHNFELEQLSSFTAFSLACRQAGMTGWEAAQLEKCTRRTVILIAALQQLRELSTMG
jgi:hypothetical protein